MAGPEVGVVVVLPVDMPGDVGVVVGSVIGTTVTPIRTQDRLILNVVKNTD